MKRIIFPEKTKNEQMEAIAPPVLIFEGLTHYYDNSKKISFICATFSSILEDCTVSVFNFPFSIESTDNLDYMEDKFIDNKLKLTNLVEPFIITTPITRVSKNDEFYVEGFAKIKYDKDSKPIEIYRRIFLTYAEVCLISLISNELCTYTALPDTNIIHSIELMVQSNDSIGTIHYNSNYISALSIDRIYIIDKHTAVVLVNIDLEAFPDMTAGITGKRYIKYFITYTAKNINILKNKYNHNKIIRSFFAPKQIAKDVYRIKNANDSFIIINNPINLAYSYNDTTCSTVKETIIVNTASEMMNDIVELPVVKFKGLGDAYLLFKNDVEKCLNV